MHNDPPRDDEPLIDPDDNPRGRRRLSRPALGLLRVAMLSLAVLTPVVALELVLETGLYDPTDGRNRGNERLLGERLQVIADLRERDADAQTSVFPSVFASTGSIPDGGRLLFPLSGVSQVVTVYCNEAGSWLRFAADEHGFNNPVGLHSRGRADVVVVGDSYAQGMCVPTHETPAGGLRAHGWHAVSIGSDGSGPLIELALLTEYGLPLEPHTVVWLYFEGNDLRNLEEEARSNLLRRYLDDPAFTQRLRLRRPEIDARLRAWLDVVERYYSEKRLIRVHQVRKLSNVRGLFGLTRPDPPPGALFEAILRESARRSEANGGTFLFVYIPAVQRFEQTASAPGDYAYRDAVLQIAHDLGLTVVDLLPVVARHDDPPSLYGRYSGRHFTVEGYRLLVEEVAARVTAPARREPSIRRSR